jgi:hypothetical protein
MNPSPFDVAMDDPLRVGGIERIDNLNAEIKNGFNLQRLTVNPVPECLPLQQFHRNECSPIDLVNFVDRADVRMVERRGRTCLDDAHAPTADLAENAVMGHRAMEPF